MAGEKQARYVITADDQTQQAIKSAQRAFDTLNKNVTAATKGLNTAFNLVAGVGLAGLVRKSVEATAALGGPFADALQHVKDSAGKLLEMRSGLPGLTEELNKLSATLRDPATVAAADAFFGGLAKGASIVIRGWAALGAEAMRVAQAFRDSNPELEALYDKEIIIGRETAALHERMEELRKSGQDNTWVFGALQTKFENLNAELRETTKQIGELSTFKGGGGEFRGHGASAKWDEPTANERWADSLRINTGALAQRVEVPKELEWLTQYKREMLRLEQETATEDERSVRRLQELEDNLRKLRSESPMMGGITDEQAQARWSEGVGKILEDFQVTVKKIPVEGKAAFEEFSEYGQEAMRGIQGDLKQFFLNPAEDGIRGLGRSIIETFKNVLADKAAAQLAEYFASFGGSGSRAGSGGWLGTAIGAVFGGFMADGGPLEQGKWHIAGEHGPEPIWGGGPGAFATGYGKGGGAVTVAPVYNIDARGATNDLISALPGILRQNSAETESRIIDGLKRGRYSI